MLAHCVAASAEKLSLLQDTRPTVGDAVYSNVRDSYVYAHVGSIYVHLSMALLTITTQAHTC